MIYLIVVRLELDHEVLANTERVLVNHVVELP